MDLILILKPTVNYLTCIVSIYCDKLNVMSDSQYLNNLKKSFYNSSPGKVVGVIVLIVFLVAIVYASLHQVNTMQKASKAEPLVNGSFTVGSYFVEVPLDNPRSECPTASSDLRDDVTKLVPKEYMAMADFDSDSRKKVSGATYTTDDYSGFAKQGRGGKDYRGIQQRDSMQYVCKSGTMAAGWERYSQNDNAFQWFLNGNGFQIVFAEEKGIGLTQSNLNLDKDKVYQVSTVAEGDVENAVVLLEDEKTKKAVSFPLNSANEFVTEKGFVPTKISIFSIEPDTAFKLESVSIVDYTEFADTGKKNAEKNGIKIPPSDDYIPNVPPVRVGDKDNELDKLDVNACQIGGACGESCVEKGTPEMKRPCHSEDMELAQCLQDSGAVCGKLPGEKCSWHPEKVVEMCESKEEKEDKSNIDTSSCQIGGACGESCVEKGTPEMKRPCHSEDMELAQCLQDSGAVCGKLPGEDNCKWIPDSVVNVCEKKGDAEIPSQVNNSTKCMVSGCNGEVCTEVNNPVNTTCMYKPEYACYKSATCEYQPNLQRCGWTMTPELKACLDSNSGNSGGLSVEK